MSLTLTPLQVTDCDREPIHAPGSIQPHGMMLVADRSDLRVRHVAGDVERHLGGADWLGKPLSAILGETLMSEVAVMRPEHGADGFIGQLATPGGEMLDVTAHSTSSHLVVELEAASTEGLSASMVINRLATAAAGFERAASLPALCDRAAIEFRRLTGFDRGDDLPPPGRDRGQGARRGPSRRHACLCQSPLSRFGHSRPGACALPA